MYHKLGEVLSGTFTIGDPANDGVLVDADSTPTGTVYKNLVADALAVTVTKLVTGKYKWTCTPSAGASFSAGDSISVMISATVGSGAYATTVKEVILQAREIDDLAQTGADGDTLETLSDQIDGTSTFNASSDKVDVNKVNGNSVTSADDFKATGFAVPGDEMKLESTYDAAKTASQFDASSDEVDVGKVKGTGITSVDDFKANVSALATLAGQATIVAALSSLDGKVDTVDSIVDAIKAVTDLFSFTGNDVKCTLDGETVSVSAINASSVTSIVTGVWAKVVDGTRTAADVLQLINAVFRGSWVYDTTTKLLTITNEDSGTVVWDFSTDNERTTS